MIVNKDQQFLFPVIPAQTLSNLNHPMMSMYQLSELVGEDQRMIWRLPADFVRNKSERSLLDHVLVGREKRWSIFQNIFTNGGETYSRHKVSFGEIFILFQ